ncbi:MAG: hypothetical protein AAGF11_43510 [Myxococcota bacterium]
MSIAVALGLAITALHGASPEDPSLRWDAPTSCPSASGFEQHVRSLSSGGVLPAEISVYAWVRAFERGFSLELVLHTPAGSSTRRAEAPDCEALVDAAALIVVTFVEPLTVVGSLGRGPEPVAHALGRAPGSNALVGPGRAPPERAPSDRAPPERAPSVTGSETGPMLVERSPPRRRAPDHLGIRLMGIAGVATLPGVDLGPRLVLGWRRGLFALEASALALLPRQHVFDERPELRLRLWMVGGDLCANLVMPVSERLEFPIGVGLEAGPIIARGQGVARPRTARQPWVAARGVVHLVWRPDPRWGLWVGAAVVLGVVRPSFTLSDQGPFEVSPGGLRGMMGVQWRWTRATRKNSMIAAPRSAEVAINK